MTDARDATWRALFEAASAYRKLAPWDWMFDRDLFGVRDPATGSIGWCAVLGAAGEFLGLAVYRGDRGFDFHRRLQADPNSVVDEAVWGQEALVVNFVDRNELPAQERERIRRLGVSIRGRAAWPQFENHEHGRLPLALDHSDLDFMLSAITQGIEVAQRFQDDEHYLLPDEHGRLLVRGARQGDLGLEWFDDRVAPPAPQITAVPPVDQLRLGRIRARSRSMVAEFECSVFAIEGVVGGEDEPPYVPAVFLLADAKSGMIAHTSLGHPLQRVEMTQTEFLNALESLPALPRRIVVDKEDVARVIEPIARALEIDLKRVDELPAIEEARAGLSVYLAPRHARLR